LKIKNWTLPVQILINTYESEKKSRSQNNHPPTSEKWATKELILYVAGLSFTLIFLFSQKMIANYPNKLFWSVFIVVYCGCLIYFFNAFKTDLQKSVDWLDRVLAAFMLFAKSLFVGFIINSAILSPFNIYDHYVAKNNIVETVHCNIDNISYTSNSQKHGYFLAASEGQYAMSYTLNDKGNTLRTNNDIVRDRYEQKDYKDYTLLISIKQGLLGSFIIQNWSVEKKHQW
jgi:hypothetical protein